MRAPRHILLVRFSSLGDVVLTTSVLEPLRDAFPDSEISFVTKREFVPVLEHNPSITRVMALEDGESVGSLAARLRAVSRVDLGIDLHASLRSFALKRFVRARWITYDKGRLPRAMLVHWGVNLYRKPRSVRERFFEAVRAAGVTGTTGLPRVAVTDEARSAVPDVVRDGTVILAPGARHRTKRWPPEYWMALFRRLEEDGRHVRALGRPHEIPPGIPAITGLRLDVVAAVLERARLVVANDSGLMHLATAVETPVIALFGPTVREFGFFPPAELGRTLERNEPCRPCSAHGSSRCPLGHHRCMVSIDPDEVFNMIAAA